MLRSQVKKSAYILQRSNEKLNIIAFEIINQILDDCQHFIWFNKFEFCKFTKILQISTEFIIYNKVGVDILSQFLVLSKKSLQHRFYKVFVIDSYYSSNTTQKGSDELILFSILKYILCQQFTCAFIIYTLKCFGCLLAFKLIFARFQFFFKSFIVLLSSSLILSLTKIGNFVIKLSLELIFKDFDIFNFIYIFLHNLVHFYQLCLILPNCNC